jgi:hypothetical protein
VLQVQCITNFVSMDIMANVLLAAGMSPAMAHSLDEVCEAHILVSKALLRTHVALHAHLVAQINGMAAHCKYMKLTSGLLHMFVPGWQCLGCTLVQTYAVSHWLACGMLASRSAP